MNGPIQARIRLWLRLWRNWRVLNYGLWWCLQVLFWSLLTGFAVGYGSVVLGKYRDESAQSSAEQHARQTHPDGHLHPSFLPPVQASLPLEVGPNLLGAATFEAGVPQGKVLVALFAEGIQVQQLEGIPPRLIAILTGKVIVHGRGADK